MTLVPQIAGFLVRPFEARDTAPLQRQFDLDPDYFQVVNGRAIPVEEICSALPDGRTRDDKFLFVIEQSGELVGMIDVIRGYPEPDIWFLGFLYVVKDARGHGVGRGALHGLYDWAKMQGAKVMRLGVVEPNMKARWLYATEGFVFEAIREVDPSVKRMRRTLVLRRPL